jgi:dUTP pyrophosphatase
MDVKIKKLDPKAVIPKYAKPGDAGMDLTAISCDYDVNNDYYVYGTGLAIEIPQGFVGLIFPRSSNRKTDAYMTNHVGVIDSGYRGEIMITYKNRDLYEGRHPYDEGDRVAQLIIMPYPAINLVEVEELSETERGEGGHGSTGK